VRKAEENERRWFCPMGSSFNLDFTWKLEVRGGIYVQLYNVHVYQERLHERKRGGEGDYHRECV
jgi:hypothetical protein